MKYETIYLSTTPFPKLFSTNRECILKGVPVLSYRSVYSILSFHVVSHYRDYTKSKVHEVCREITSRQFCLSIELSSEDFGWWQFGSAHWRIADTILYLKAEEVSHTFISHSFNILSSSCEHCHSLTVKNCLVWLIMFWKTSVCVGKHKPTAVCQCFTLVI